jgi:hypothetical protein
LSALLARPPGGEELRQGELHQVLRFMPVAAHQVGDPEQLPGLCRGELEILLFGIGGMIPQRGSLAACLALDVTNTDAVIEALSIGTAAGISLSFQPSLHWFGLANTNCTSRCN